MTEKYSKEGNINLELVDKANNFTNFVYEQIKPFLKGTILEVGSGIGTYSKKIINDFPNNKIMLSDIDEEYVNQLKNKFTQSNVDVVKLDLMNKYDFGNINKSIDAAFALNVLEHVKDDVQALNNIYDVLSPGGLFIILVPAHKFLFNCIDESIGHYRRYNKREILKKLTHTKFKIRTLFYFNFLSLFGWFWTGNILRRKTVNESAMSLFNSIVPILRIFEKYVLRKKIGISLIVVLEK